MRDVSKRIKIKGGEEIMGFDKKEMAKHIETVPRMMPYKVLVRELSKEEIKKLEIEKKIEDSPEIELVEFEEFRPECGWGKVVDVGKGKFFGKKFVEPECVPGDIVAYNKNFEEMKLFIGDDDHFYYIFDYGDCLLIYKPED